MSKSVNLLDIRFSDINGNQIVREEYNIVFESHDSAELFIQDRHNYWMELLNKNLVISPRQNETIEEIEIQKVFKEAAKAMGLSPRYVFRKTRAANIIEVRRIGIAICVEFGLSVSLIGKAIGFDHSTVVFHRDKFYDLCEFESGYEEKYNKVKDVVLTKINGEFLEDGSGKLK